MNEIPEKIQEAIEYVLDFGSETNNWLTIKKQIMWQCEGHYRLLFSRRHYSTKKHSINDFERKIIAYWHQVTGIELSIPENLIHDPTWTRHRRGWGLKKYNKERQRNAIQKNKRSLTS